MYFYNSEIERIRLFLKTKNIFYLQRLQILAT